MKIKATKKFSKLGSSNNWERFGKDTYISLEQGATINCDCPEHLLEGGYVKEVKSNKKEKEDK